MYIKKDEYLKSVLESYKMGLIEDFLNICKKKREEVKKALEEEYREKIYNSMNSGSYAKHTAINVKFDLDFVLPFERDSFDCLEDMFDNVYKFLHGKYRHQASVRKQKVSIGIEFENGENVISLDVVPGRELNKDQYKKDNKLNLYIDSKYGLLDDKSYIQTNIKMQIEHIKARENARRIIRLLKIWKAAKKENYKSFFLELITIKSFDEKEITGNLWDMLKCVMEYIGDNVDKDGFSLEDPGNTNNDVARALAPEKRTSLAKTMKTIIRRIEDNNENIKLYFPVNEKFGTKVSAVSQSTPPNNQRFG